MFRHLNVFQYGEEELKIYTAWTSVRNSSLIDCHFITINLCSSLLYLHSLTLLNIQKIAVLASEFFSSRKLVVIKKNPRLTIIEFLRDKTSIYIIYS